MTPASPRKEDRGNRFSEAKILSATIALIAILVLIRMAMIAAGQSIPASFAIVLYGLVVLWFAWFVIWAFLGGLNSLLQRSAGT